MVPDDMAYWQQVAAHTLALSAAITAPLTQNAMQALRVRAAKEGLTPEALVGTVQDQAELIGIVNSLYDLHLPLLSVELLSLNA